MRRRFQGKWLRIGTRKHGSASSVLLILWALLGKPLSRPSVREADLPVRPCGLFNPYRGIERNPQSPFHWGAASYLIDPAKMEGRCVPIETEPQATRPWLSLNAAAAQSAILSHSSWPNQQRSLSTWHGRRCPWE